MSAKPYESPTTPGLMVTFRNYLVELVCLNVQRNLGPRFWKDKRRWQPKYTKESVALARLLRNLDEYDPIVQRAMISVVDQCRQQTFMVKNRGRLIRQIETKRQLIVQQRTALARGAGETVKDVGEYLRRNKPMVSAVRPNRLNQIEGAEDDG